MSATDQPMWKVTFERYETAEVFIQAETRDEAITAARGLTRRHSDWTPTHTVTLGAAPVDGTPDERYWVDGAWVYPEREAKV